MDPEEDKTEFFGDGPENFPRRLPENCLEYVLLVINNQLEARKLLSTLENLRKVAVQLCDSFTKDYIWQREPFQLSIKNHEGLTYLYGTTDYGDSVEDEWLITYILRELSRSHPQLWVRVSDSDGEFPLIEAANVLPAWLSPEIDSNRAWINQGQLKIIPLDQTSPNPKRPLTLTEAASYLGSKADALVYSPIIEAEAFYRLEKYPGQITDSIHHSLVTIPRKLAFILHEKPTAIAPAVEAFYLRDPPSMKALLAPPKEIHFPPTDLITLSVKFTKTLFAQLKSQEFAAPPIWTPVLEAAEASGAPEADPQRSQERLEMGMKLTCGFEMLAIKADKLDSRVAREFAIVLQDVEEDGEAALPTVGTIRSWEGVDRDDNDSWLDINYEEFEKELEGKRGPGKGASSGFGDASTHADLQKIVERFEAFLNDDKAGLEGAEIDDMDEDDDSLDSEEDSEDEDKEVSFNEEQFAQMMRQMMGLPTEVSESALDHPEPNLAARGGTRKSGHEDDEMVEENEEIRRLAAQMEAELNEYGALTLDPTPETLKTLKGKSEGKRPMRAEAEAEAEDGNEDEDSEEEVNIDYNLAKNLLESFKSQGGMPGPASNILGMMGMHLPRDEDDSEETQQRSHQ